MMKCSVPQFRPNKAFLPVYPVHFARNSYSSNHDTSLGTRDLDLGDGYIYSTTQDVFHAFVHRLVFFFATNSAVGYFPLGCSVFLVVS